MQLYEKVSNIEKKIFEFMNFKFIHLSDLFCKNLFNES